MPYLMPHTLFHMMPHTLLDAAHSIALHTIAQTKALLNEKSLMAFVEEKVRVASLLVSPRLHFSCSAPLLCFSLSHLGSEMDR